MNMPFGRHRGKRLCDLPENYLWWLSGLDDLREPLRSAVYRELERRDGSEAQTTTGGALEAGIIRTWHREMCLRFHPDRGGDVKAFQAINHAYERLKELAGVAG